jgi:hypothetical protein
MCMFMRVCGNQPVPPISEDKRVAMRIERGSNENEPTPNRAFVCWYKGPPIYCWALGVRDD